MAICRGVNLDLDMKKRPPLMMSEVFDTKPQQNARGKVRATSIFLFRERRDPPNERPAGRLDREMAPVK